ncbi:NAD(P)-dependent oxidoreductase [Nocardia asteroides]|uniref:NAD(P)-dependent oxidoreductase n=1 Tax=Nocardia asteroides TaxID=1824 RepID=UPI001E2C7493|nr:NAD(P)-binding domain-containing protein [Nocardia asteroides]UGT53296.1 NAD(P)-binding domain-containing protein [Nocardia asteroides]
MTKPSVTVLGTGSMGAALTRALLAAGHPTHVWNRSPERTKDLAAAGATAHLSIADAVAAGSVSVAILTGFDATRSSLADADPAGRDIITLNSGAPTQAREFGRWVEQRGGRYLGGAIKNVAAAVGDPDTQLYFGGDRAVFDAHRETLRVFGGDLEFLGPEPDLAALYEAAVGATLLPALLGFAEGAALLASRGLPARSMVPYSAKWLRMIESLLPTLAAEIDTKDYTRLGSSIDLFASALSEDAVIAAESGVDLSWHAPMHELLRRAIAEGRGEQSVTALFELLAARR